MGKCNFLNLYIVVLVLISSSNISAQNSDYFDNGEVWFGAKIGLSFHNDELARINQQKYLGQHLENSLSLQFNPQLEYALYDRFFIGAHLGLGLNNAENNQDEINSQNYKVGFHFKYYFLKLLPKIFIHAEVGENYNYFHTNYSLENQSYDNSEGYFKTYLDAGISFFISDYWVASLIFKDIVTHHSNPNNFDGKDSFSNNNFQDFINFPHFSIIYRLN